MLDFLLDPLAHSFMQRALLASVLAGGLCAIVGCYVVLRGMAFLGDALAHAVLPGIAIAFLLGGDLFAAALATAILVALGMGYLGRSGRLREDAAIGVVFSGAFALGVALISSAPSYQTDLTHILFGNVLGVTDRDLLLLIGFGMAVLVIVLALYKELLAFTFDPTFASSIKLPVEKLRYLLMVVLAVTVVVSLRTVGVGLVAALLVTPAAAASMLTRRLSRMMVVSALIGVASAVVGLYVSYYGDLSAGASIVLTCTVLFLLALVFSPRDGMLARLRPERRSG
ncbi:MAG TPA: metal ABC transporter permease [Anaerolineae bacterium]|nr:metal ABC transporter permease [Anaerolineae bacterium]